MAPNQADLAALAGLIGSEKLTPVTGRTYPLAEVAEAIRYSEQGHTRAKVITGYDVLITRDRAQLNDPSECAAIKKSGLHHVRYTQRLEGMRGLALAFGALIAAMPMVMQQLQEADSQRLVKITSIDPRQRFDITDPRRTSPSPYWPR